MKVLFPIIAISCLLPVLQSCYSHEPDRDDRAASAANAINTMPTIDETTATEFYKKTMNAAPFLPQNQDSKHIACALPEASQNTHKTSLQANYSAYQWEQRIAHNWSFFDIPASNGRITLIDIKQYKGQPAYRYLANSHTQNELYEPWSSSKIFAYTGAMAQLRMQAKDVHSTAVPLSHGLIGEHHIADMITSINSYEAFSKADGNSNDLASFFANIATRNYLSNLFYDEWLKLSTPHIYFRGAYGPTAFTPTQYTWHSADNSLSLPISMNNEAALDPGYLEYRCDDCALTGNKPMTTLAQAEWFKRLVTHSDDPATAHPAITQSDVDTLFYGTGHSQNPAQFAGMTMGISTMLHQAIAANIDAKSANNSGAEIADNAKAVLDNATNGNWRVFQKIGWGPSETRSTAENVVLAYVCLPQYKGGKAFVVAAQVAVPNAKEENVALAGIKMQALLSDAMRQYLAMP